MSAVPHFEQRLAELPADQRIRWHRHVIKSGDTLGTIAHRYRTSVSALKQANSLRGTTIRKGRSLMVPMASPIPRRLPSERRYAPQHAPAYPRQWQQNHLPGA